MRRFDMASDSEREPVASTAVTITSAEFRADSRSAMKQVAAGKTVTVTDASGAPRMHILRQTERLED
jgi:hypothetical protein